MDRQAILDAVAKVAAAHAGVRVAMVFGSMAKDRTHASSDVDVAIVGHADVLTIAAEISARVAREVDVVEVSTAAIPLLDAILRDGVVVYERSRGESAAFRSRTLAMLETDRVWYRRMADAWLRRVADRGILGR